MCLNCMSPNYKEFRHTNYAFSPQPLEPKVTMLLSYGLQATPSTPHSPKMVALPF